MLKSELISNIQKKHKNLSQNDIELIDLIKIDPSVNKTDNEDDNFSEAWNKFLKYLHSDDFIENIRKFSGIHRPLATDLIALL